MAKVVTVGASVTLVSLLLLTSLKLVQEKRSASSPTSDENVAVDVSSKPEASTPEVTTFADTTEMPPKQDDSVLEDIDMVDITEMLSKHGFSTLEDTELADTTEMPSKPKASTLEDTEFADTTKMPSKKGVSTSEDIDMVDITKILSEHAFSTLDDTAFADTTKMSSKQDVYTPTGAKVMAMTKLPSKSDFSTFEDTAAAVDTTKMLSKRTSSALQYSKFESTPDGPTTASSELSSSSKILPETSSHTGLDSSQSEYTTELGSTTASLPEASSTVEAEETVQQPNIVFVLADDYGYSDIGYHGSDIQTPVMDRLAAEGVKLENYYVQPMCAPTRSQLLTGRYQIHTGLQHDNIEVCQPTGLPLDNPTLADKLKEAGYSTQMVGKWHLGYFKSEYMPHNRGFDYFYGMLLGHANHYNHKHNYRKKPYIDLRENDRIVRNETGHYSTHLFTKKAVDIVKAHDKAKPLFLYLSYQAVHGPIQVPESYKTPYGHIMNKKRKAYAGMVSAMDEGVGMLENALKQEGMWNNTVLVFSSDNGGRVKFGSSNYPLRGEKHSLWEGGVKSIGFVSGGLVKRKGAVSKDLMHVSDWFPTLVNLAGGNLNGTKPLDGVDQWDAINEGTPGKRQILLHNIDPLQSRRGRPKYKNTFDTSIRAALRAGDLKLITGDPDRGVWLPPLGSNIKERKGWNKKGSKNVWLFNITADPNERKDLSYKLKGDVKRMLSMLETFEKTAVEPFYPDKDNRCNPASNGNAWGPWM
ncbi:arylsulfatase b [Plakobranchus ocellatus]|uniref:Arylsulfatase b n=1 Tax=Plakobranchus ocellatus TaxID=259542 RepID=A0AAV4BHC3_9GAST|nr:arylsulfatase b [Plakobranchus ocellatus]